MSRHTGSRLLVAAALGMLAAAVARRAFPVRVRGDSMAPTLVDGDFVACIPVKRALRGDVVVLRRAEGPEVVKRVAAVGPARFGEADVMPGEIAVLGDNATASTDSRAWGAVPFGSVAGRALAVYWPPQRWRRVERRA
jgi:signal peptidase I